MLSLVFMYYCLFIYILFTTPVHNISTLFVPVIGPCPFYSNKYMFIVIIIIIITYFIK